LTFGERNDGFLDVFQLTGEPTETTGLTLADKRVHSRDFDAEESFHGSLDFRLGSALATLNTTWFCSETSVDFSVIEGDTITS